MDTVIAFVAVLAGLSMTLQLLMEVVKRLLGTRARVYGAFLRGLYHKQFDKEAASGAVSLERENIQSVGSRFRNYLATLGSLHTTAAQVRREFDEFRTHLGETPREGRADFLEQQLRSRFGSISARLQSLRGFDPGRLFAVLCSMKEAKPSEVACSTHAAVDEFEVRWREVARLLARWEALRSVAGEARRGIADEVYGLVETVGVWLERFDVEIGNIKARLEAGADNALAQLEQSYGRNVRLWCFGVAVVFCALTNADAIEIYSALGRSPQLTQSVLEQRDVLVKEVLLPAPRSQEMARLAGRLADMRAEPRAPTYRNWADSGARLSAEIRRDQQLAKAASIAADRVDAVIEALDAADEEIRKVRAAVEAAAAPEWAAVAASAQEATDQLGLALMQANLATVSSHLEGLLDGSLPLGWHGARFPRGFALWLLGVLATAFAISFGSPFWNDLLKALVGLKGRSRAGAPAASPAASPGSP